MVYEMPHELTLRSGMIASIFRTAVISQSDLLEDVTCKCIIAASAGRLLSSQIQM